MQRIFVNAAIKKALCREAKGDRSWLSKIRPMVGPRLSLPHPHRAVRAGSRRMQGPAVAIRGRRLQAADLAYWFRERVLHPKPPPEPPKPKPPMTLAQMPAACRRCCTRRMRSRRRCISRRCARWPPDHGANSRLSPRRKRGTPRSDDGPDPSNQQRPTPAWPRRAEQTSVDRHEHRLTCRTAVLIMPLLARCDQRDLRPRRRRTERLRQVQMADRRASAPR